MMSNHSSATGKTLTEPGYEDKISDRLADVVVLPVSAGTRGVDLFAPPTPAVATSAVTTSAATSAVTTSAVATSVMSDDYFRPPILPRVEATAADKDIIRVPSIAVYEADKPADPSVDGILEAAPFQNAMSLDPSSDSADPAISPESATPVIEISDDESDSELYESDSESELEEGEIEEFDARGAEEGEMDQSDGRGAEEGEIDKSASGGPEPELQDIGLGAWPKTPPLRVPGERYYDYIIDMLRESDGTMLHHFGGGHGWDKPRQFLTPDEKRSLAELEAYLRSHKMPTATKTMPQMGKKEIKKMLAPFAEQRAALLKERHVIVKAQNKKAKQLKAKAKQLKAQAKLLLREKEKALQEEKKRIRSEEREQKRIDAENASRQLEAEKREAEKREAEKLAAAAGTVVEELQDSDAAAQAELVQYRPQFHDEIVYAPRPQDKIDAQTRPADNRAPRDAAKASKLAAADMVLGNQEAAVAEESQAVIHKEQDESSFFVDLDGDAQMGDAESDRGFDMKSGDERPPSRRQRRQAARLERELQSQEKSPSPARDSSPDFEILELDDKAKAEFDLKAQARERTKENAQAQSQAEALAKAKAEAEAKAKAKAEIEAKAKAKAEAKAKAKAEFEAKAKAKAEAKAKAKAAKKAKSETPKPLTRKQRKEAKRRAEAELKAQAAKKLREARKQKAKAIEPQPEPEPPVDLDLLLENLSRGSDPEPIPLLKAPPQVLGKRLRSRSLSPDIQLTEELFDEVAMVNELFTTPCLKLVSGPAVFELAVAGKQAFKVNLSFSDGYPLVTPTPVAAAGAHGPQVQALAVSILADINDGKPCLEKLVKGLVHGLSKELGSVDWKFRALGSPKFAVVPADARWFPSLEELNWQMETIRSQRLDYPPKLPSFEDKEGWRTAFISESYAREIFAQKGAVVEGNERLEFLGDSVLNALIATSLMKMYQLSEGGMTKFHDILRSNVLFCIFSRAYGFPEKLHKCAKKPAEIPFKEEADIFEAVVGGLYLDGGGKEGGWIALQKWFDVLIEPWIDWIMARLDQHTKDAFTTFNHIPLNGNTNTAPRRPALVPKSRKVPRQAPLRARRAAARPVLWAKPPASWDDHLRAGPEHRRYQRIVGIERKMREQHAFKEQLAKNQQQNQPQPDVVAGSSSRPHGPPDVPEGQYGMQPFMHPPGWHWEQPYAR